MLFYFTNTSRLHQPASSVRSFATPQKRRLSGSLPGSKPVLGNTSVELIALGEPPSKRSKQILSLIKIRSQKELTPNEKILYRESVTGANKTAKLGSRLKNYQRRLRQAEKVARKINFEKIFESVNTSTYNFIISQIKTQKKKHRRAAGLL